MESAAFLAAPPYMHCWFMPARLTFDPMSDFSTTLARDPAKEITAALWRRLVAAAVVVACAIVLGIAAWLPPSPTGLGTHRALNLPPCGWIAWADLPCPTCGMTTAFAHAADGNLPASFHAQPFGFLLALATAMTLLVSLHVLFTGSRLGWAFARLWGRSTGWIIGAMVVLAWGYKVLSYKGWV
jgi:hypothetical protein